MAIQITGVSPVVSETPQNNNAKKNDSVSKAGEGASGSFKVNISGDASFLSYIKQAVETGGTAGQARLGEIKRQVASGNYADSSKIAGSLISSLNITGE